MFQTATEKLMELGDEIQAAETTIFELEAAWRALDRMPDAARLTGEGRELARRAYQKRIEVLSLEYDMAADDRRRVAA
jgi:hypothetical protein